MFLIFICYSTQHIQKICIVLQKIQSYCSIFLLLSTYNTFTHGVYMNYIWYAQKIW